MTEDCKNCDGSGQVEFSDEAPMVGCLACDGVGCISIPSEHNFKDCWHTKLGMTMDQACIMCWRERALEVHDRIKTLQAKAGECLGGCPHLVDRMTPKEVFEKFPMTNDQQVSFLRVYDTGVQHVSSILQAKGHLGRKPVLGYIEATDKLRNLKARMSYLQENFGHHPQTRGVSCGDDCEFCMLWDVLHEGECESD